MSSNTSAHGCMAPCPVCNKGCPICNPCDMNKHTSSNIEFTPLKIYRYEHKCDLCGSTAIDHTEAQCQINRLAGKR